MVLEGNLRLNDIQNAPHRILMRRIEVCFKIAFRQLYVTLSGRFAPNEGRIADYETRIWWEHTEKWGVLPS